MNAPLRQRLMLVDDEEGVRVSWDRYLSSAGFDVTTVEDGVRAISRLRKEPADVVVSDLRMPGVDGLKLLEWMHASTPDTPFILLTGYGDENVESQARELGAFEYLEKPISPEALSAVITAALLQRSRAEKQAAAAAATADVALPAVDQPLAASAGAAAEPAASPRSRLRFAAEIVGGLIMAPLMGLAFVIFFPLIGFGALLWTLGEPIWKRLRASR